MIKNLSSDDLILKLAECETRENFMSVLAEFIEACEAKYAVVYTFNYGRDAGNIWTPTYSTYPADLANLYRSNDGYRYDQCLRVALHSCKPVRFADIEGSFKPCPVSNIILKQMREVHGLKDALAMIVSDKPGRLVYLNLAYDRLLDDVSEVDRRRIHACFGMIMSYAGEILEAGIERALSPKEREVLALLAKGKSNKEIARKLNISISTVNTLVSRCFNKLGAHTRTEAAIMAARAGLSLVA